VCGVGEWRGKGLESGNEMNVIGVGVLASGYVQGDGKQQVKSATKWPPAHYQQRRHPLSLFNYSHNRFLTVFTHRPTDN
jgi:hypothetical protein